MPAVKCENRTLDDRRTDPLEPRTGDFDLRPWVRPGDRIVWGQGAGEPRRLTRALVDQRAALGGVEVFLGVSFSDTFAPEHADHIRFRGLGGFGTNARLTRGGALEVVPCHLSAVPGLIAEGRIGADVVFVQVSPAGRDGWHSLGVSADYIRPAIERARVVIAEVDQRVPRTRGDTAIHASAFAVAIESDQGPCQVTPREPGAAELAIGELVAERISDGSILQLGIGAVPDTVAAALHGKRDLGIHTSLLGDRALDLIESGAVTNARKPLDPGITIAGMLAGTRRLYDFAHENPEIQLRPVSYTHALTTLGQLDGLVAVNSAIEIDLTGQVNAESARGIHLGAVGGAVDFMRGAAAAAHGCSIVALPSTARAGEWSRIVPRLMGEVVTAPRSDVDLVVTEYGVADLRGFDLEDRARRLTAIAHPGFREELASAWRARTSTRSV